MIMLYDGSDKQERIMSDGSDRRERIVWLLGRPNHGRLDQVIYDRKPERDAKDALDQERLVVAFYYYSPDEQWFAGEGDPSLTYWIDAEVYDRSELEAMANRDDDARAALAMMIQNEWKFTVRGRDGGYYYFDPERHQTISSNAVFV